jgi:(p)ppGpp synthase/HD superfamily hydrolase
MRVLYVKICFISIVSFIWDLDIAFEAVETVVAGILHDVVHDTCQSLHDIEEEFGDDVAELVASVSRLSYINQVS